MNTILPNFVPTAMLPMLEVMFNYDSFRNIPIVPESERYRKPSEQYNAYTSSFSKVLGKLFNVSPRKVDHLIRGYGGGVGEWIANVAGKGLELTGAVERKVEPSKGLAQRLPIVKGLTADAYRNAKSIDDFYNALNDLEVSYQQERDSNGIELNQFKDARRLRELRKVNEELRGLRKQYNEVYADNKMSSEAKREKLSKINIEMINLARKVIGKPKIKQ
jgi:hypothetical protein